MKVLESKLVTDVVAASSIGTGAYTWLVNLNEILQAVSLLISIGLGVYAYYRIYKAYKK